ncbi:MAG: chromosomal replication initiator protein DnaA [Clostridiales bacterium]|jgi:chromosomal replication initiator protein|nr:chromosomal replication initiator protein DnaA [Clostridiales bacterium]
MQDSIALYWTEALSLLQDSFSDVAYTSWIKPLVPLKYEDNVLTLQTERDFFMNTINQRYLYEIKRCFRTVVNDEETDVKVVSLEEYTRKSRGDSPANLMPTNLRQKYVFETFVRGKSNELAYAASQAVAESPGESSYNPLFLYGGVGLGKTHLMHSIGNYVFEQNPELKILYLSAETFTNEFVSAIRNKETSQFKDKYRTLDVLLLDDVQFLEGKEETQEELFHTFNSLYNNNKQIVLTSDQPPKELKTLENRLVSRFAMGLICDITHPDYETRMAILEKKAELEHLVIPKDVIRLIAKNIASNIRDLEGALNKVTAFSRFAHTPITMEKAEDALRDVISRLDKPEISVEYIQEVVAAYYELTVADLNSRKRTQNIVYPRQIAMYLSRKLLDVSLPDIGKIFGGRDHSTVIHGCDKITYALENDISLQHVINDLERRIKSGIKEPKEV